MKLSHKLILSFSFILLTSCLLGAVGYFGMASIFKDANELATNWMPTIKVVSEIESETNRFRRTQMLHILTTSETDMRQLEKEMTDTLQLVQKLIKQYEPLMTEPAERENFPKFLAAWEKYVGLSKTIMELSSSNQNEQAGKLIAGDSRQVFREAQKYLTILVGVNIKGGQDSAKDAVEAFSSGRFWIILTLCVCIAAGTLLALLLTRNVLGQLGEDPGYLQNVATEIAGGNLDLKFKPVSGSGGVYAVLIKMVENLKAKISEADRKTEEAAKEAEAARQATAEAQEAKAMAERAKAEGMFQAAEQLQDVVAIVTSASEELSAQIEQSSHGSEQQARRISETATAMEEMNATILEVAKNASQSSQSTEEAKSKAEEGAAIVTQVVKGIGDVQIQAVELKSDMDSLGKQASGIGQILNVISDIADQTNLLALNAAIEAARAGEAGRGFAVVADEVRKLAEKTQAATKEVGDAIHGIQNGTSKNIQNVERTVKTIELATDQANKSGDALGSIVRLIETASDQVRSIATASEQESAASEEINRAIEEVSTISSETAQAMTQAAQAVSDLAHQAQVLQNLITAMKNEGGAQTQLPSGARKALA
ncbi:methyl-accepting chemotaxis protein [Fundidesulfovibrio putealis]|uniref:methyl-accepting chemotaxis protein n=1 Tax=Fundidesulfovibrio putealis TaxID=270496 RepID=UPI0004188B1D|nr:methyl-accepting chemotaxis protein [Fundidesulfovibrio putealis]